MPKYFPRKNEYTINKPGWRHVENNLNAGQDTHTRASINYK